MVGIRYLKDVIICNIRSVIERIAKMLDTLIEKGVPVQIKR